MASTDMQKREAMPVAISGGVLSPRSLPELIEYAKILAASQMVPKQMQNSPGDVIIAMQMGAEVGLSPMASLQSVAVVNGRPTLFGDAVLAVCLAHPDCEDVIEVMSDAGDVAQCTVKRRGRSHIVRAFSVEDAKRAGLWGKQGPWTQYPKRMLQMRARGFALRDAFPDALRGIRIAEEERDVIDVTASLDAPPPPKSLTEPGVHKLGKAKERAEKREAKARDEVLVEEVDTPHDPQTGEVIEAPKPTQDGLGW